MPLNVASPSHCNICSFILCETINNDEYKIVTGDMNSGKAIKTCSGCKLIGYCSPEHQKLDWKKHMELCRAVQTVLISKPIDSERINFVKAQYVHEFPKGPIQTLDQLLEASCKIELILEKILKRKLYYYERDLITFPRICPNCLSFKVNPKYKCYQCNEITYCSKTCMIRNAQSHIPICNDLKMYYNFYDIREIDLHLICNYNDIEMENIDLIEYLQKFTEMKIPKTPTTLQEYQIFSSACNYSYVCTILKLIQQFNFINKHTKLPDEFLFTIFFVGAKDELKYFKPHHCKFLLSQLPAVKKLKLVFIGPDLKLPHDVNKKYEFQFEKVKFDIECETDVEIDMKNFERLRAMLANDETTDCEEIFSIRSTQSTQSSQTSPSIQTDQTEPSTQSNVSDKSSANTSDTESQDEIELSATEIREVHFELLRTYFADYVEGVDLDLNFIANMVVCFNCQFNEINGDRNRWKFGIKRLLQMKRTPIVFTSRTKLESKLDMKCIFDCFDTEFQKEKLFVILKTSELNTMCDLRPYRNPEYSDDDEIYHQNGYVNAVLGKSDEFNFDIGNRYNMRFLKNVTGKRPMETDK